VNVELALTLLELLRFGAFGRLIHLSSSEVYGTADYVPMDEQHPLLAETTYAAGKAAADLAVASYVRMFDLDALTIRPFNNYGPRQNDTTFAAVIPLTVQHVMRSEPPVIEGDGEQTRDFTFVKDTAGAIMRLAESDERGRVLNVGSGRETSIGELVRTIAEVMGWSGTIEHAPARPADVRRHCASVERAEAIAGPISVTPLEDGLAKTIDWYMSREAS
jgi:UDP-glucose 4-epimerase